MIIIGLAVIWGIEFRLTFPLELLPVRTHASRVEGRRYKAVQFPRSKRPVWKLGIS